MKRKTHGTSFSSFAQSYIDELTHVLTTLDISKVEDAIDMLMYAYKRGKKIFIIGNGGSASNASHMANDFSKGTLMRVYDHTEKRFKIYSLTDNVALLTAFANDVSYEDIFIQQLRNLLEAGDIVIALSGSGNSPNVVKAVAYARKCRAKTIGILGFRTGGKVSTLVDCAIIVDSMHYGPCEDTQLVLNHMMISWIAKLKVAREKSIPRRAVRK